MTARVDIAGVLERAGADEHAAPGSQAWALALVGSAVAELIAADKEYDEAKAEFDAAHQPATHTRSAVSPKHGDPVVIRYRAAFERRFSALARVGGA